MKKIKDILNICFKYRYIIALVILVLCTIFKISGSSVGIYNDLIQPNMKTNDITIGFYRGIRSDEWIYELINSLSQKQNGFNTYNDHYNAVDTFVRYPDNNIITILLRPYFLGLYFLDFERAYAFLWWVRFLFLVLVTIEFMLIITDENKKWTLVGTCLVALSPAILWWYSSGFLEFFAFVMLIIVIIDKYLKSKNILGKILLGGLLGWTGACFVIHLYPAMQVPLAYVTISLAIFVIIKNYKKGYRLSKKDILIIIGIIALFIGLVSCELNTIKEYIKNTMSTAYPGHRINNGGDGIMTMFGYVYDMWLPYSSNLLLNCETANFYSLFPIPVLLAVIYFIRTKKDKEFYIPVLIVIFFLTIYTLIGFIEPISKITLMSYSTGPRSALVLGFITTILMIYMGSHILEERVIKKYNVLFVIISILMIMILAIITMLYRYIDKDLCFMLTVSGILLLISIICVINYKKEYQKILMEVLIIISLISSILVNPIQIGTSVLTEKPIAKKVQEINKDNYKDNIWLIDNYDNSVALNNYFIVSNAKVINSLAIYPNLEFWKTILEDDYYKEEYEEIYNRYAYIEVILVNDEKSNIELKGKDYIILELNVSKLKELNINYVIATRDLEELNNDIIKFKEIYNEDNMKIYNILY